MNEIIVGCKIFGKKTWKYDKKSEEIQKAWRVEKKIQYY
jgi:hypothetical protein